MIADTFITVFLTSLASCLVNLAGIYIISQYAKWGSRNVVYFMSFAAGVLISVSFVHIIPESFNMNGQAPFFLLAGFMGLYIFNRFIDSFICADRQCVNLSTGIIPMIGIGLHSFVDGIIYAVTFNVSILTGALAAIGMVLHEFPEGVVTFLMLQKAGFSKKKSIIYAILAAAVTTPLGTLLSFPLISQISRALLGNLLAFSAGALVYVGATHLLPAVEKENRSYSLLSLAAGILIALFIALSKGA